MAPVLPFLAVAAAAISAISSIQQGRAAKAASKYNATIADQNAQLVRQDTKLRLVQQSRENYQRLGAIRAAQGASGGTAAGSVLDVIGDAAAQGELQKQYIARAGENEARGYNNTANLDRAAGKNAERAGYMAAGSALLGGAGDYYSKQPKAGGTRVPSGNYSYQG